MSVGKDLASISRKLSGGLSTAAKGFRRSLSSTPGDSQRNVPPARMSRQMTYSSYHYNEDDEEEEEDEGAKHHDYLSYEDHRYLSEETRAAKFAVAEELEEEVERIEHEPHPIFTEMLEWRYIVGGQGSGHWREVARWVKFEEDVDEGGQRWSKPHVASPALYSLSQLHTCIADGCDIIDMHADNWPHIVEQISAQMLDAGLLLRPHHTKLRDQLLAPKQHQFQHVNKGMVSKVKQRIGGGGDKPDENGDAPIEGVDAASPEGSDVAPPDTSVDDRGTENARFFKKLPHDAEALCVFAAEVDYVTKLTSCFVRLRDARLLKDLPEVPIPTRFVFLVLGPRGHMKQYRDVGRAMAVLMSDTIFHDMPYRVHSKDELLVGVDEFLDEVTVLPPGTWNPDIRLEPPQMRHVGSMAHLQHIKAQQAKSGQPPKLSTAGALQRPAPDPLIRSGRLFGGLVNDIKRKLPFYLSDYKDAIHEQCLATFFFMYFAILAPVVTFGGLLEEATDQNMAALENIMAAALCGITYALFSGQPLTILGSTGPVLVFETLVYQMAFYGVWDCPLDYMSFRLWINVWIGLIMLVLVATDASVMVKYITRFTEESFATLIALIFIWKCVEKLVYIHGHHAHYTIYNPEIPNATCECTKDDSWWQSKDAVSGDWLKKLVIKKNGEAGWSKNDIQGSSWYQTDVNGTFAGIDYDLLPLDKCIDLHGVVVGDGCYRVYNVFFMSVILTLGTFTLAMFLRSVKHSMFLTTWTRNAVGDFAITFWDCPQAVLIMVGLDALCGVRTPKLNVPTDLSPTNPLRGSFIINPFLNEWYTWLLAGIPAVLCSILLFMDQQITAVIVNRKDNKLNKGGGYHLDLFVLALQIIGCGVLGLPVFVAATVRSINHLNSLKVESETSAPGERPFFMGVREQRLTAMATFIMVGCSIGLAPVLRFIPMPVLYGVFLYMGISALDGVQMVDRIKLILVPMKYQPDYLYLRHVPIWKVHMFTVIQVVCFVAMWCVKEIQTVAIAFPLMLLVIMFTRKGLEWAFTRTELRYLDDPLPPVRLCGRELKPVPTQIFSHASMEHGLGEIMALSFKRQRSQPEKKLTTVVEEGDDIVERPAGAKFVCLESGK